MSEMYCFPGKPQLSPNPNAPASDRAGDPVAAGITIASLAQQQIDDG